MNTTKKIFTFLNVLIITFVLNCTTFQYKVLAKKLPKQETTLTLKARHGGNIVYGSVLNSKENEVKAKLPKKVLAQVKKEGIENLSITITKLIEKKGEKSNIYTLKPSDSVNLFGKTVVINLLNSLKDVTGSIYTAGALQEGTYELALSADKVIVKGNFVYKPPVVTVGNVTTKSGKCVDGIHQINDLTGEKISEIVALSNCSYFNEVQANRIEKTKKSRKLLHQEVTDGTTPPLEGTTTIPPEEAATTPTEGITTTPPEGVTTIPPEGEEVATKEESTVEIAIAEAVATTSDGEIEKLSAAIELDPENNGKVEFNIDESTTQVVNSALDFIQVEEDLEFAQEVLKEEVEAAPFKGTEAEASEEVEPEEEKPEAKEEEFEFDPECNSKFASIVATLPLNPSGQELLDIGNSVIAQVENGELKNCFPKFIKDIIEFAKSREDVGIIAFAKKFIFHVKETQGNLESPNLDQLCIDLKKEIKLFESCKEGFCPPPPCIHPDIRETLKKSCPEILALVPLSKCEGPRVACDTKGGPVEILGASCIDFESADSPNLCEPCNSDADCFNPKEVPETNCTLPINVCRADILDYYGTPLGKVQAVESKGICYFNGTPKNPFTCEELVFVSDPQIVCLGPPEPALCTITDGTVEISDRRCCKDVDITLRSKTRVPKPKKTTLNTCIFKRICSDQDTYFHPGEFGFLKLDVLIKVRDLCVIETNSFDESGEKIVACFNNSCPDSPLECLEQIESVTCDDPKCNLGNCDSGFIGLPE